LKAIHNKARDLGNVWARRTSCDNGNLKEALESEMSREEASEVMKLVESMDFTTCMVKLLGFSCNEFGDPDEDSQSGEAFMVLELGGETLRDRLDGYLADAGGPGSLPLSAVGQVAQSERSPCACRPPGNVPAAAANAAAAASVVAGPFPQVSVRDLIGGIAASGALWWHHKWYGLSWQLSGKGLSWG